jgi:hypothetical protein
MFNVLTNSTDLGDYVGRNAIDLRHYLYLETLGTNLETSNIIPNAYNFKNYNSNTGAIDILYSNEE